ncbi:hypothetical protein ABW636_14195 [Aquimarina sp. 2201CG1-2-11]|uniref:hypothetical protein n=1 Tax=Aquimarina discodermiae TaxID=3231043 RepID=UPI00346319BB
MKFKDIREAKLMLINCILMHIRANKQGDVKTVNKNSDKIWKIKNYIEKNYGLEELKALLNHDNDEVLVWIAQFLLPVYEEIAIKVLREIENKNIPHCSFNARVIISEWTGEPLKFD